MPNQNASTETIYLLPGFPTVLASVYLYIECGYTIYAFGFLARTSRHRSHVWIKEGLALAYSIVLVESVGHFLMPLAFVAATLFPNLPS